MATRQDGGHRGGLSSSKQRTLAALSAQERQAVALANEAKRKSEELAEATSEAQRRLAEDLDRIHNDTKSRVEKAVRKVEAEAEALARDREQLARQASDERRWFIRQRDRILKVFADVRKEIHARSAVEEVRAALREVQQTIGRYKAEALQHEATLHAISASIREDCERLKTDIELVRKFANANELLKAEYQRGWDAAKLPLRKEQQSSNGHHGSPLASCSASESLRNALGAS